MPSSISSSRVGERASDLRRVALRTAIAGCLILAGGLGLMRCNVSFIEWVLAELERNPQPKPARPAFPIRVRREP